MIVPTEHHANASAEDIKKDHNILHTVAITEADEDGRAPTEEEKATLRHVSAPIPWYAGLILGELLLLTACEGRPMSSAWSSLRSARRTMVSAVSSRTSFSGEYGFRARSAAF